MGDWVTLLTAIATLILAYLAYTQNQVNKRSQKIDIALRYQKHFTTLHEAMTRLFKGNTKEEILIAEMDILRLRDEAELIFNQDVIDVNNFIYKQVNMVIAPNKIVGNNNTNEELNLQSSIFYNEIKSVYKNHTFILAEEEKSCLVKIINKLKSYLKKHWVIGILFGLGAGALFWCASLYFPYNVSTPSTQKFQLIDPLLDR